MSIDIQHLTELARLVRYFILKSTTAAGSGHPTSSLSAVELMVALFFGGILRFDLDNHENPYNDRVIFSKGHASPLFYALYAAAGKVTEEQLLTLRKFGSPLEGHPMLTFRYTEAATGSLGQGLSIGAGMALAQRFLKGMISNGNVGFIDTTRATESAGWAAKRFLNETTPTFPYKGGDLPRVYVLLGDSEMAEGSVWEAIQWAGHARLDNLIGILDVNRLGQSGETMLGHDVESYARRIEVFGWRTIVIDGHKFEEIIEAYGEGRSDEWKNERTEERKHGGKPLMIIAKTLKGKGISFLEDKEGWHGRALSREELEEALQELGSVDTTLRGVVALPERANFQFPISNFQTNPNDQNPKLQVLSSKFQVPDYKLGDTIATRKAYGAALAKLAQADPRVVALDAEVKNSTFAEEVLKKRPEKFVEMYISEQNMAGVAVGLARRGLVPFCSTFAAFFTRAFDQIRMAAYSQANVKFCGSHAGVSIGEDGPSQMGLEDLAQFRAVQGSTVLYPADAVSCEKLVIKSLSHRGIVYIRTTRGAAPVIYEASEQFPIGEIKIVRSSKHDTCMVVAAGITLHETLAAYEALKAEGIETRVIDLYSVKPLDVEGLRYHARETRAVVTVEDHVPEGGIGEAVAGALAGLNVKLISLAVRKTPKSGKPQELLAFEEIDRNAIMKAVKDIIVK